jgi:peptidoglycan/LPS O-acetylase OafA/YrhL
LLVLIDHGGLIGDRAAGSAGVTVFFVLSGFLITDVIMAARDRDDWSMGQFLLARAVRLVPALIVMEVAVTVAWLVAGRPVGEVLWQVFAATFYIKNMALEMASDDLMSHAWSLATEEQFYLVWPLVLPFVMRSRSPMAVISVAVMASMFARLGLVAAGFGPWAYASLASNAFGLLLGCLLVVRPVIVRPGRLQRAIAAFCLAAIFMVVYLIRGPAGMFMVPIVVALFAAVMVAFSLPGVAVFELAWLRFVGRISYALYLWHWPVLVLLGQVHSGVSALPALGLSFVLAVASTVWLEEPLRRAWRRRALERAELVRA